MDCVDILKKDKEVIYWGVCVIIVFSSVYTIKRNFPNILQRLFFIDGQEVGR